MIKERGAQIMVFGFSFNNIDGSRAGAPCNTTEGSKE
jgi:hypothetical protein